MSLRTFVICSSLFFISSGCTPKTPEQQFIDDAMRAVGGRDRVIAVKSIVIEGTGVNYNLGQDLKPEAETDPKVAEVVKAMGTVAAWLNPRIL